MEQAVKEDVIQKVKKLIKAPSCCAEARAAGTTWLESIGTEKEAEATKALIAELEMDIIPIDVLIAFAGSEAEKIRLKMQRVTTPISLDVI